jgi:hypothetical protein
VGPPENDHRTNVAQLGLLSEVQLCTGIVHKDEVTRLEVKCQECGLVLAFELACRGKARLEDVVSYGGEVIVVQLELLGMGCNKVDS